MCACLGGKGGGGHSLGTKHKDNYKYLNWKMLTSEWDSKPRPHEH